MAAGLGTCGGIVALVVGRVLVDAPRFSAGGVAWLGTESCSAPGGPC